MGASLQTVVDVPCGAARERAFPLLGRLPVQNFGGRPLLPPSIRGRVFLLLLIVVVFGDGGTGLVFGRRVRSALMAGDTPDPLAFPVAFFAGAI